jgi:cytoskeletal protein CcmA (bactofilin family)
VIVEDVKLTRYTAVTRFATCGRLEVTKKARLVAEVRAGELVVKGSVTGDIVVTSRIEVYKTGRIEGALRARRLKLALGGTIEGPCRVGPEAVPEAPE